MQVKEISEAHAEELESVLRRIPVYRELREQDPEQFDTLMKFSRLVEVAGGDTIMRRGDRGSWIYFLLTGQLAVSLDDSGGEPLNFITPGEMFGDLALFGNLLRNVTVRADENCRVVRVMATDFSCFGRLTDFSTVSLRTKLRFYRLITQGIRWRLEMKKVERPVPALAARLMQVPIFRGAGGTVEELAFLNDQARLLAELLLAWNTDGADLLVASPPVDDAAAGGS